MGDLQFGSLAAKNRPVFRPVELESLARLKRQRNESATAAGLLFSLSGGLPIPRKGRHAILGAFVAEADQVGV